MSRRAPVGAHVKISYDSIEAVAAGDALVTDTGRVYRVVAAKRSGSGTWRIDAIVDMVAPAGARQHRLVWHRRERKNRT